MSEDSVMRILQEQKAKGAIAQLNRERTAHAEEVKGLRRQLIMMDHLRELFAWLKTKQRRWINDPAERGR